MARSAVWLAVTALVLATVQAQGADSEADPAPIFTGTNATAQNAESVASERTANYTKLRPPLTDVKVSQGCSHHFVLPFKDLAASVDVAALVASVRDGTTLETNTTCTCTLVTGTDRDLCKCGGSAESSPTSYCKSFDDSIASGSAAVSLTTHGVYTDSPYKSRPAPKEAKASAFGDSGKALSDLAKDADDRRRKNAAKYVTKVQTAIESMTVAAKLKQDADRLEHKSEATHSLRLYRAADQLLDVAESSKTTDRMKFILHGMRRGLHDIASGNSPEASTMLGNTTNPKRLNDTDISISQQSPVAKCCKGPSLSCRACRKGVSVFQYCITHPAAKGCSSELLSVKKATTAAKAAKTNGPQLTPAEKKANAESIGLAQQLDADFANQAKKDAKLTLLVSPIANAEEHESEVVDKAHAEVVAAEEEAHASEELKPKSSKHT